MFLSDPVMFLTEPPLLFAEPEGLLAVELGRVNGEAYVGFEGERNRGGVERLGFFGVDRPQEGFEE